MRIYRILQYPPVLPLYVCAHLPRRPEFCFPFPRSAPVHIYRRHKTPTHASRVTGKYHALGSKQCGHHCFTSHPSPLLWASCCVFLLNGMGMSVISASTGPCRLHLGADFPPFFPAFSTSTSRHEDKHPPKQFYRPERFSLAVGTAQTRGMRAETQ